MNKNDIKNLEAALGEIEIGGLRQRIEQLKAECRHSCNNGQLRLEIDRQIALIEAALEHLRRIAHDADLFRSEFKE